MSTYAEKLAASKAAWLAFCTAVDKYKDLALSDERTDEIADLWEAYILARAELGGEY